jgi:hypothetical protein
MLHKETISPHILELLIRLQQKEYLKGFFLVGGTALALQIGHRTSVDLDLFSDFSFDTAYVLENLSADFDFKLFFSANNTLKGSIEDVQVDILAHRYPYVCSPLMIENIAMVSAEDIIAMKLNAISISGQRIKDFIDIFYLMKSYSIDDMIHFYKMKYAAFNEVNVLKSLTWFEDIDHSDMPVLLENPELKWSEVSSTIRKETQKYLRKT